MKKDILQKALISLMIVIYLIITNYPFAFLTKYNLHRVEKYIINLETYLWVKEHFANGWKYYNGFLMYSLKDLNKDLVERFYENNLLADGKIDLEMNPQSIDSEKELDFVLPIRTLLYLDNKAKYRNAMALTYRNLIKYETLPKCGNNFKHKIDNFNWEKYPFALDGLYMALPFLVEYKNFDVSKQLNWVSTNMKAENGLYFHGAKADGTPNGIVWLRGVGWYAMTQIDILDNLPEGQQKEKMKSDLISFFDSMLKYQNKYNGMWKNVLYPKTFLCNKYETSGTLMMSYALLKAYNNGYASDKKYKNAGLKAFNGVVRKNLGYELKNIHSSAFVSDNIDYYCHCYKYVSNDPKGIAPLILTYEEILKMK